MSTADFSNFNLKTGLHTMIKEKGFTRPTPIQMNSIPLALEGHDIIGQAQTGTGKTAAFGIPILNNLNKGETSQALVLCPTRELAIQVSKEIAFLGRRLGVRVLSIYGGQPIERQISVLKYNPEIIVATPGRLLDHIARKTISLANLKYVVIDEADEMLDMGFFPDIEKILVNCPSERQTFLFSATLDFEVRKLGKRFMQNPKIIAVDTNEVTVPKIKQTYYKVSPNLKIESLVLILENKKPAISLIFCRTKRGADALARKLKNLGYNTDSLHGDMSQRERDIVMHRFRNKNTKVLIATDLAARGLDISHVTHVINYDIPEDTESYVHRVGRTGRAGKTGEAITLVEPNQIPQLRAIERFIGKRILEEGIDTKTNQAKMYSNVIDGRIRNSRENMPLYKEIAEELLEKYDQQLLVTSLIGLVIDDSDLSKNKVTKLKKPEGNKVRKKPLTRKTGEVAEIIETDMINMEVPIGKKTVKDKGQLIDFIIDNTTVTIQQIGDIEIEKDITWIEVPINKVDEVYEAVAHNKHSWSKNLELSHNSYMPIPK